VASLDSASVPLIMGPTSEAFMKLLEKNRSQIEIVPKKTFKYGTTDRHQLDVYYPASATNPPILLFTYGGGLFSGDRVRPESNGLLYTNLGAFFAHAGYLTVIADYRLVPAGAVFPNCLEDVRDALTWVVGNLGSEGDTSKIYLMGHSAGALNQISTLLHPSMVSEDVRKRIKGIVLNGGAYHADFPPEEVSLPPLILNSYFGPPNERFAKMPLGMLKAAPESVVRSLPAFMFITAEKEPKDLRISKEDMVKLLKERGVSDIVDYENPVHNHLSSIMALSSGEGDEWAYEMIKWMKAH